MTDRPSSMHEASRRQPDAVEHGDGGMSTRPVRGGDHFPGLSLDANHMQQRGYCG
jgi:hypothetical protein